MISHMTLFEPTGDLQSWAFAVANAGWIGVDLFFVLSGYLISGILLDAKCEPGYIGKFWARRALRILPLYYAVVAFSLIILPNIAHPYAALFGRISGDEWSYWLLLSNFSIAQVGMFRHGILDVSWSLAIEEQFYIVWPLIVLLLSLEVSDRGDWGNFRSKCSL